MSRRIGLLGGSFNPAHGGHLHISLEALKRLKLDEIWWLVSPHNPLKIPAELAPYETRFKSAAAMAQHPRIKVLTIEQQEKLYYTVDTVRHLKRRHPRAQFVWLMGADNLLYFHRWKLWRTIVHTVPIAILDRLPYAFAGLHGRFALRFDSRRISANAARQLFSKKHSAWCYITLPRHPLSASFLRKTLGEAAFSRHNDPS